MRLLQKPALVGAVIVLAALALPAMSAASEIQAPAGTRASVGLEFVGSGRFEMISNIWGAEKCDSLTVLQKITKNDGASFESSGTEAVAPASGCEWFNEAPATYENMSWKMVSSQIGKGQVQVSFTMHTVNETYCKYSGSFPFEYAPGSGKITVHNATGVTSSGCGSAKVSASFTFKEKGVGSTGRAVSFS